MLKPWLLILAAGLTGGAGALQAAPFTPTDDSEIVQRLPQRIDSRARAQHVELARHPQQLALAIVSAREAIDRGRRDGDPRELGAAQAALAPWWKLADPPAMVRLLRATLRQSQHDFDAALVDLDVLSGDSAAAQRSLPELPLAVVAQAGLTRAAVLQVTGRLSEARRACERLTATRFAALGAALSVPVRACIAELSSLQGQPQRASADLARLALEAPGDAWLALLRAELAERLGDNAVAAARYRETLASQREAYAVAAYADFLLTQGRDREVVDLLGGDDADLSTQADAWQLRRAIALQRLQLPQAAAAGQALSERFAAARQRGENFHAREESRLALDFFGRADDALKLAQVNWSRQKEPADALLLVRAALAANQPAAAEPVRQLVRDQGWFDQRIISAETATSRISRVRAHPLIQAKATP
jgi:hypothetical protein